VGFCLLVRRYAQLVVVLERSSKRQGCTIGCKSGRSQLHNLQKLCYSFGLGCYRNIRENPEISIAAKEEKVLKRPQQESVANPAKLT
jgi:hypothetical protein